MRKFDTTQSEQYFQKIKKILPGGVHHNFVQQHADPPIIVKKAKDSHVWDLDGNMYIDLFSKYGALILGHSNIKLQNGIRESADSPLAVEFSENTFAVCSLLQEQIPACQMVRFGLSGTEAVQNAIRLARAYTGKEKIVRFQNHFHGSADNVLGGCAGEDGFTAICPDNTPFSTKGRANNILSQQMYILPFNDLAFAEKLLSDEKDNIAAVLLEGVMVNSGGILPKNQFLSKLKELCTRNKIVYILDEMITGIRMGIGGAHQTYDVMPDLCIYGKAVSNGIVPMSMLMGKKEIMQMYDYGAVVYGGTYNGYSMGLSVVHNVLTQLLSFPYYEKLTRISTQLHSIFTSQASRTGLPIQITGPKTCASLMYASDDRTLSENQRTLCNGILRQCLTAYGVLIAPVSRIFPNLSLTDSDMELLHERVGCAFQDAEIILSRLLKS